MNGITQTARHYEHSSDWSDGKTQTKVGFVEIDVNEAEMLTALFERHHAIIAKAGEEAGVEWFTGTTKPLFDVQAHGVFGLVGWGFGDGDRPMKFELGVTDCGGWVCGFREYDPSGW